MVLISAGIYLYEDRCRRQRENQTAKDILEAIETIETAIRWENCPLPDSVRAQMQRKYAGEYFREIGGELEKDRTLQEAWNDTFCRIKPQRISQILCGIPLSGDSTYLEDRLAWAAKEIRSFQIQERESQADRQKVKAAAAVSVAATIVILLL